MVKVQPRGTKLRLEGVQDQGQPRGAIPGPFRHKMAGF